MPYDKRHKFNFLIDTTMTQKEKLYFEYLKFQNSIYAVKGETVKQINLDEFSKTGRFMVEARNSKVYELQESIKYAKQQLERYEQEAKRDAWFETAEGMQFKQDMETRIEALKERMRAAYFVAFEHTRDEVRKLLGAHVDVINFGVGCMTIGIVKSYDKDGNAEELFGHTFEVRFGRDVFKSLRWELNYGTLGGFDLDTDITRTQHLVALSTFAANKTVVPALRDYLHAFVQQHYEMREQLDKLERELNNPTALTNKE